MFISPKVFSVVLCLSLFPLLKQPSIVKAQTQVTPDNPSGASASVVDESVLAKIVEAEVAEQIESSSPVIASRSSNGFRLETRDGNWQTNFQLRAQMRFTTPYRSDPRQVSSFESEDQSNFEARRLRMKVGGHGRRPWLRYYTEVDMQPSRDVDDGSASASARVIDYRIDIAKWDWLGLRLGQWKVDLNRERVDSSGRQQFVERSIANRVFTMDRQLGVQLRGHLFQETAADLRYFAGVFNGEGRGVNNTDADLLYTARLQWNFMGRDLAFRQTDVEFTEEPIGSLAIAGFSNTGSCTRWSSSGCGNLDGFASPGSASPGQFEIKQVVQEYAFKYRGFSTQQEFHRKTITDNAYGSTHVLTGGYAQAGYFLHNVLRAVPAPLEVGMRYAYVNEPNASNRIFENDRREVTVGVNWFIDGHDSKVTLDFSRLTIDDALLSDEALDYRLRLQWDVQF